MKGLICGWGINDVNYPTRIYQELPKICGVRRQKQIWICPYYSSWRGMIRRVHDSTYQNIYTTYKGCTIHEEWKFLSNFIKWVDSQPNINWQNCHLDKDILVGGNKHYGPNTCVFIPNILNLFIGSGGKSRGNYMIGVSYRQGSSVNPYQSRCDNPFTGKKDCLGAFPTELEAHKAWQAKKHEFACMYADLQSDERVADALLQRYAPDKDWTNK